MMIVMKEGATEEQIQAVVDRVESVGCSAHVSAGEVLTVIGAIGDRDKVTSLGLEGASGVDHLVPILKPYKLASAQFRKGERTVIDVDGRLVGGEHFTLIAGPCTVESREQTLQVADVIQVGARNMQNYALLAEAGRTSRPVLLKRGLSATLEELLMAAEYVLKEGNENVMLCERGIRTFETTYRFTLDLLAIPALRELTHLPVVVDPSHAAGRRDWVQPMSLAAAAAGADGIIVEVHNEPDEAICDGPQAVPTERFPAYAEQPQQVAEVAGNV